MFIARESNTTTTNSSEKKISSGSGFLNKVINKTIDHLPFEAHIPGYQYCGPGTHIKKRLKRGDPGINPLNHACKEHDIAYQQKDASERQEADRVLASKAWSRVKSQDAGVRERISALAVAGIMKAKSKLGAGVQREKTKRRSFKKKMNLSSIIQSARKAISCLAADTNAKQAAAVAFKVARLVAGKTNSVRNKKRIIPVPQKVGGILLLIPVFAGLSALVGLAGGVSGIINSQQR